MIGIDISSVAITGARARIHEFSVSERAHFEVRDITATALAPLSCDGAICIDMLWMMPDKVAVLGEMARILRVGARLLLTTWEFPPGVLEDGDVTDYRPALAAAGFEVEVYDPVDGWEGQFRALLASYEAARDDLEREFGEEMADDFIEFERQRAALVPEWKRVFVKAHRV